VRQAITQVPISYFYKTGSISDGKLQTYEDWVKLEDPDFTPSEAYSNWLRDSTGINVSPLIKYYNNEGLSLKEWKGADRVRIASIRDQLLYEKVDAKLR
jgi:aspartate/methionine/tyrosine aminotransferase